jgi:hypothetical protein
MLTLTRSGGFFANPGGLDAMGKPAGLYVGTAVSPIGGTCWRNPF